MTIMTIIPLKYLEQTSAKFENVICNMSAIFSGLHVLKSESYLSGVNETNIKEQCIKWIFPLKKIHKALLTSPWLSSLKRRNNPDPSGLKRLWQTNSNHSRRTPPQSRAEMETSLFEKLSNFKMSELIFTSLYLSFLASVHGFMHETSDFFTL